MNESARTRFLSLLDARTATIRKTVTEIPERRLFIPIAMGSNSAGHLTLHVAGSLLAILGLSACGVPYERDRDREFKSPPLSRDELLREFDASIATVRRALQEFDLSTFDNPSTHPRFEGESRGDHLLRSIEHVGYHAGQIVLIGKVHQMIADAETAVDPRQTESPDDEPDDQTSA